MVPIIKSYLHRFISTCFAWLWVKLNSRQPSTANKFAIGLLFAGLSFLVMIIPAYVHGTQSLVSPIWLVISFLFSSNWRTLFITRRLINNNKKLPAAAQTMSLWF